jgi:hypothetical protein
LRPGNFNAATTGLDAITSALAMVRHWFCNNLGERWDPTYGVAVSVVQA